jgi:FSR family fosmidomycin resistance protein-like MFS transporter
MASLNVPRKWLRRTVVFVVVFMIVEFLDEFIFGAREAAWPIIRSDLGLNYAQIGLLLAVPALIANMIEPILGILGDVWNRRLIIIGGGVGIVVTGILTAASESYLPLIVATTLYYPCVGAFVALSQATLMDIEPTRHEQNMARWTFAVSIGVVVGSIMIGSVLNGSGGWRIAYVINSILTLLAVIVLVRLPFPKVQADSDYDSTPLTIKDGLRNAWKAIRRPDVIRWLTLLQLSDFMLDILHGYIALYFVDVVGANEVQAALAVGVWSGIGLIGDFLLIPLLERVRGLDYLRFSAVIEMILYVIFLLVPSFALKLVCLGVIGMFNAGWYAILQANLYSIMPDQSGTVLTMTNIANLFGSLIPLVIGILAEQLGLQVTMWFFLLGPIGLLIGLPRHSKTDQVTEVLAAE